MPTRELIPSEVSATSSNGRRLGRRLRDLLRNEARLQHRLLALATETREAIIEHDTDVVIILEAEHRKTLDEAQAALTERQEMSRAIARVYHVPVASLTLSHVLDVLPAEVAIEIGVTATLLLETIRMVRATHAVNRDLLEDDLAHRGVRLEVAAPPRAARYSRRLPPVSAAATMLDRSA